MQAAKSRARRSARASSPRSVRRLPKPAEPSPLIPGPRPRLSAGRARRRQTRAAQRSGRGREPSGYPQTQCSSPPRHLAMHGRRTRTVQGFAKAGMGSDQRAIPLAGPRPEPQPSRRIRTTQTSVRHSLDRQCQAQRWCLRLADGSSTKSALRARSLQPRRAARRKESSTPRGRSVVVGAARRWPIATAVRVRGPVARPRPPASPAARATTPASRPTTDRTSSGRTRRSLARGCRRAGWRQRQSH